MSGRRGIKVSLLKSCFIFIIKSLEAGEVVLVFAEDQVWFPAPTCSLTTLLIWFLQSDAS